MEMKTLSDGLNLNTFRKKIYGLTFVVLFLENVLS
jgi:hypothetical protein